MTKSLIYRISGLVSLISPDLYLRLRDRYYKFRFRDRYLGDAQPTSPIAGSIKNVSLEISIRCNLRCTYCWWWGENGIGPDLIKSNSPLIAEELKTQEIFNLIDQLYKYKPSFYIAGGEPFIRKDTLQIIEYINSKGMNVSLTDNGTLLNDEIISRLSKIKNLSITFSIDGLKEMHDKIRGNGNFDRTINNINRLIEKRGRNKYPTIRTNTTMAPENIDSLYELAIFLDKLGVDEINFQHLWYTNKIVAKTHKEVLSNEFGLLDNGVDSHVVGEQHEITSTDYADKVANFTQMLLRNIVKFRSTISFYPLLSKNEIIKYYTDNTFSKYQYCMAPWNEIAIKANGDVMFCPDEWITEFKLGNIKENTIDQLWNNEQAQKFRSFIIKKGRFPICNHCCFFFHRLW